jgi:hypothetical protein
LALALGRRLGLPVHHLDAMAFRPGGAPVDRDAAAAEVARVAAGAAWIVEGNHGAALAVLAARPERVAVLRLGRWRSLWRIARRRVRPAAELRDKGPGGGPQTLPWHLVRHTLLVHPRIEPGHVARIKGAAAGEVAAFADPRDALAWLVRRRRRERVPRAISALDASPGRP